MESTLISEDDVDNTDEGFKTKMTPLIEPLMAELKALESKADLIEAKFEIQKSEARRNATESEADLATVENLLKGQRRAIMLLRRKLLACRLMIDGYPSEELLELLKSGRRS
ncbi:hypothetical protein V565_144420 [Rhizoctonia solani 123E]|uniref:Uncharacterized protein n=1 Tax=Rhizoctonia solani 123E TaxID=1423351 RepID=A0A074RR50_9AGAM|nr:hypothetical protein V565_144420 [Rhizoctonia solani 123E]